MAYEHSMHMTAKAAAGTTLEQVAEAFEPIMEYMGLGMTPWMWVDGRVLPLSLHPGRLVMKAWQRLNEPNLALLFQATGKPFLPNEACLMPPQTMRKPFADTWQP